MHSVSAKRLLRFSFAPIALASLFAACSGGGDTRDETPPTAPATAAPTVSLSVDQSAVVSGQSATLSWSSTDADSCAATGAWGGSRPTSGSASTGALTSTSTFTLTCTGSGGSSSQSVNVSVTTSVPAPTVSISASPTSVASGASSTLTWSSTNATGCVASGAWSGNRAVSGSASTGALTASSNTFTLTCTGVGGSAGQSATVTVASTSPAPTVQLSASPAQVTSGSTSTLNWSSTNADTCTASGAWTGARAISGSEATAQLTAAQSYTLSCTGVGGSASRSVTVTIAGSGTSTGLDFQGNASTTGTVRFQFTNPLAIYPATYVWKVYPRQQSGYYTTFFWGNNGAFWWDGGSPNTYYGAHPYPTPAPNGSTHKWELAVDGGDVVTDANGNDTTVAYNRWYTQALRVWSDGSGKHHEFYWDLPDVSRVIRVLVPSRYGNTNPPSPVLVWGDAPWNPSNEILNGVLRGIQIYSSSLSVADILSEIASPASTSSGASNIWYMNVNPTPADISDKSGRGHNPEWVGGDRPLLWNAQ